MNQIIIDQPLVSLGDSHQRLSAQIDLAGTPKTMWFTVPTGISVGTGADPFLIALLTTAMNQHAELWVKGELSRRLADSLPTLQAIFRTWYPQLAVVPLKIDRIATSSPKNTDRVASFFSGGVDSFYTAIQNDNRVSALILVHGFDIPLTNLKLRHKVSTAIQDAAKLLGKEFVEIETNSREITEPHAAWPYHQFGPALASVAAALGNTFNRILIPSSETYCHLAPRGSHPLTDPFWSTDQVTIEHDGADATRDQKTHCISQHAAAMKHLRVCWRNPDNAYNCGKCEKCVRTMVNLLIADALEKCQTFPDQLEAATAATIEIPSDSVFFYVEENLAALRSNGRCPEIALALEGVADRYRADKLGREIAAFSQLPTTSLSLADGVEKHRDDLMRILVKKGHWKVISSWIRTLFGRKERVV